MADDSEPSGPSAIRQTSMAVEWSDGTGDDEFNSLLGRRVKLSGLTARPELNGQVGRVFSCHDSTGRAGVKLDSDGSRTLAIRFANLVQIDEECAAVSKDET